MLLLLVTDLRVKSQHTIIRVNYVDTIIMTTGLVSFVTRKKEKLMNESDYLQPCKCVEHGDKLLDELGESVCICTDRVKGQLWRYY